MRRLSLPSILVLAFALRFFGLDFGLPSHEHAYSYNPDEWTPLQALKAMEPSKLDFNPHYFDNPTFHYYLYGAGYAVAHLLGWINILGTERYYFDHPEHLARMIWLGRLYSVILGTATVWLVYLLARRMGFSRGTGRMAAVLAALHPSLVIHSHFMTVNAAVTFWCLACFLAMDTWMRRGGIRSIVLVGVTCGLAASTKYSGALLVPWIMLAALFRFFTRRTMPAMAPIRERRVLGELIGIGIITLGAFLAGTPYIVLSFDEFLAGFHNVGLLLTSEEGGIEGFRKPIEWVTRVHLFASTPALLPAAAGGLLPMLRRPSPLKVLAAAWIGAFFLISTRAGAVASDGRFLPLFPFLAVAAAVLLETLHRRSKPVASLAAAALLGCLAFFDWAYLGRFVGPMPQEEASRWALANLPRDGLAHLAGSATFYFPDLPLRELLHKENEGNYERRTAWSFVAARRYREARPQNPDFVFLTQLLPRKPADMEWLEDPEYEVVAHFPGKVHFLGRRVRVPLDLYDTDHWILRRKAGSGDALPH